MPDAAPIPPPISGAQKAAPRSATTPWLWIVATALASGLLTLCFFTPRYWLWPAVGMPLRDFVSIQPELHRAFHALQQLHDPFQKIDSDVNRVIEWRLLWPILGHYSGMSRPVYLALPALGCVVALVLTASLLWRETQDRILTLSTTLLAATASWFFVSTGWLAYFDSWLITALLLATFARSRGMLLAVAFLAPWIDERFIIALPLCLGVRTLCSEPTASARIQLWADAKYLIAGIVPYLALRVGGEIFGARNTSASYWSQRPLLPAPLDGMLAGVWNGLRLGWLAVALALVPAVQGRRWLALAAIGASFVLNLCIADDVSRSTSVLLPLLLAGILWAARRPTLYPRITFPLLCAGNLLLPASHIIATPLSPVERYHSTPLHGLLAERKQARHPPDFADPAVYTERGMQALAAGENAIARNQFELALRFDPEFPRARAHFGIVLFVEGKKKEGLGEIDRALAREPSLFDVRLQRATFRQQMGDSSGALADAQEALRTMPPDWPRRRDAERFAQALASVVRR